MPDQIVPQPSPDQASATRPSRPKANPPHSSDQFSEDARPLAGDDAPVASLPYHSSIFTMSKGGVGKSLAASFVAQYLTEIGCPVACLDVDPMNASLCEVRALQAVPVSLFRDDGDEIDVDAMDGMVERLLTVPVCHVIDAGAAAFVPLNRYIIQDGIPDRLAAAGRKLIIHAVVAGGPELIQTARGFDSIASQYPASADIVLWLNEHHGLIGTPEDGFETTPVFRKHEARLRGVVRLRQWHAPTFGRNMRAMLGQGLTFKEAFDSPEFYSVAKDRLLQVKSDVFGQLAKVLPA